MCAYSHFSLFNISLSLHWWTVETYPQGAQLAMWTAAGVWYLVLDPSFSYTPIAIKTSTHARREKGLAMLREREGLLKGQTCTCTCTFTNMYIYMYIHV